jgi:hypothetical protein
MRGDMQGEAVATVPYHTILRMPGVKVTSALEAVVLGRQGSYSERFMLPGDDPDRAVAEIAGATSRCTEPEAVRYMVVCKRNVCPALAELAISNNLRRK